MQKTKRLATIALALALIIALALSLAACKGGSDAPNPSPSSRSTPGGEDQSPSISPTPGGEDSGGEDGSEASQEIQVDLVPLGEWAEIYDSSGNIKLVRIASVIWDDEAGKALLDEYNEGSMLVIKDMSDEFEDVGYYIFEYEVKYPSDYPPAFDEVVLFHTLSFDAAKDDDSSWRTENNTSIIGIASTYDVTDPDIRNAYYAPGDTVSGKGFGQMIDQYKDLFYLSLMHKGPNDDEYSKVYFAVK